MKTDNLHNPIFITGIERSGSSIVAKIIASCGVFTGPVTEMQENKELKIMVNGYYASLGAAINGQFPLPNIEDILIPLGWKVWVNKIIKGQKYDPEKLWMYKSNRLCQIWNVWHEAYPDAKWIIVRRRTGDITHSCIKTGFMTAFKNKLYQKLVGANSEYEGWLWWVHQHENLFNQMIAAGLNVKIVWPERMAYGDFDQMQEMIQWLGLEWNETIPTLVQPMLKNSQQKKGQ